ncbi:class I tRNA ligase family protein, partial [Mesorhizobium sp. M8A.F.Ca.ET.142.01.1.1]|uniref:class I tRNA ligase family protein n=1 Tax=Mesorhizobium sp. M8A.F.Ca.ET.142.01.1.1 TaxID=2563958 RepID=UPI001AED1333
APYVPGWDCHGLPIEIAVEKKWGKVGTKLDAVEFRQKCREFAEEQINIQRVDFKRLGVTGSLQWKPSDATDVSLDVLYSKIDATRDEHYIEAISFSRGSSST